MTDFSHANYCRFSSVLNFSHPDGDLIVDLICSDVRNNTWKEAGWPEFSYGMSKLGITALSIIQQNDMDKDTYRNDIVVNAVSSHHS